MPATREERASAAAARIVTIDARVGELLDKIAAFRRERARLKRSLTALQRPAPAPPATRERPPAPSSRLDAIAAARAKANLPDKPRPSRRPRA